MRELGLYVFSPLLSFSGGFLAIVITLKLVWNQTLGGDLPFTLFYGGIAFFSIGFPIYLGIIHFIDTKFHKYKGLIYPLGCMLISYIPTLFIMLRFGSFNLFSSEAMLFHSFYLTSGMIFGICHWGLKNPSFSNIPVSALILTLFLVFVMWFLYEKATSYSQPEEALLAIDRDLLLIPAFDPFGDALFFFIKDQNKLGATIVHNGYLGWKADSLTWSPLETKRNVEKLNGYQKYGDHLIYGLIKLKEDTELQIKVNDNGVNLVPFQFTTNVIEENQSGDFYIWYFENDTVIEEGEIKLINKNTQGLIDSINF